MLGWLSQQFVRRFAARGPRLFHLRRGCFLGGAFEVQGREAFEDLILGQVGFGPSASDPAVSGGNGGVKFLVGEGEPGGALVVEVRQSPLLQLLAISCSNNNPRGLTSEREPRGQRAGQPDIVRNASNQPIGEPPATSPKPSRPKPPPARPGDQGNAGALVCLPVSCGGHRGKRHHVRGGEGRKPCLPCHGRAPTTRRGPS